MRTRLAGPVATALVLVAALLAAPTVPSPDVPVDVGSVGLVSSGGGFESLDPFRVLDTRFGTGAPVGKVGPGESLTLDVTGVGGVPESGVGAVVVNVTVTEPTASSHLRVHPSGTALPLAANLNWSAGQTIPNLVIAKVGADGNIVLYNDNGSSHFVADIAGWFPSGSEYSALDPFRVLDTRFGTGAPAGKVGPGEALTLDVTGVGGVPESGVGAVVVNVTVTEPTASSHLRVHPSGTALPLAANLNWSAGDTIPNLVIAKVGADGNIVLYNDNGSSHFVADIAGWFPSGSEYSALDPFRVLDTRFGTGAPAGKVGPGESLTLDVTGVGGVPESGVGAVVVNITVTEPTSNSHLRVHDSGSPLPLAANLNWSAGQTIPNLVIAKVGEDGNIVLYNDNGSSHYVADIAGWFPAAPSTERLFDQDPPPFPHRASGSEVSDDGRYAIFETDAETLTDGDDNLDSVDVFLRDRTSGTTTLVSVDERQSLGDAYASTISGDGGHVLFVIDILGLTNDIPFFQFTSELYAFDRAAETVERVTGPDGALGVFGAGFFPNLEGDVSVSDDGRYVVFPSGRDDLVDGDENEMQDLFRLDRQTGSFERVNVSSTGAESDAPPSAFAISGDGTHVAFGSSAADLVPGADTSTPRVYLRDLVAGTTEVVGTGAWPSVSDDGARVAFESFAALDVDDDNGTADVYVWDGSSTSLVSVATGGGAGDGASTDPTISGDGTTVAFASTATDLVAGDTNGLQDTFVRDLAAGPTERLGPVEQSFGPSIDPTPGLDDSGALVAFVSGSGDLVADDTNETNDVFALDRDGGGFERLSISSSGAEAFLYFGDHDHFPDLSADGRWLAFRSSASGLGEDPPAGVVPAYVRDLETGTAVIASRGPSGEVIEGSSPSISGDGRFVAFVSGTTAYVRDLVAGTTVRVSETTAGNPIALPFAGRVRLSLDGSRAIFPADDRTAHVRDLVDGTTVELPFGLSPSTFDGEFDLSGDGSLVVFSSHRDDLVPGDVNGTTDVFVHDVGTGQTELVSRSSDGTPGNDFSGPGFLTSAGPQISADGRFVTFASAASNLVPGDPARGGVTDQDTFVRDRVTGTTVRVSEAFGGGSPDDGSEPVAMSPDGVHVVFLSVASDLVAGGTNGDGHLFVWNRLNDTTRLVSVATDGTLANGLSFPATISGDGQTIAFSSYASNLVPGDDNHVQDIFVRHVG